MRDRLTVIAADEGSRPLRLTRQLSRPLDRRAYRAMSIRGRLSLTEDKHHLALHVVRSHFYNEPRTPAVETAPTTTADATVLLRVRKLIPQQSEDGPLTTPVLNARDDDLLAHWLTDRRLLELVRRSVGLMLELPGEVVELKGLGHRDGIAFVGDALTDDELLAMLPADAGSGRPPQLDDLTPEFRHVLLLAVVRQWVRPGELTLALPFPPIPQSWGRKEVYAGTTRGFVHPSRREAT